MLVLYDMYYANMVICLLRDAYETDVFISSPLIYLWPIITSIHHQELLIKPLWAINQAWDEMNKYL
jgi:hypothetical protein